MTTSAEWFDQRSHISGSLRDEVIALLDEYAAEAKRDTFECPYCGTVTKWQLKDATGESDDYAK